MSGESNLDILLATMTPKLNEGTFVFCTVNNLEEIDPNEVISIFREGEGLTLIVKKETADRLQLPYSFITSWITLTVHSSLEAVGLTAAFATALASHRISCNVVAGFYHDHIFVPERRANQAMAVLEQLTQKSKHTNKP